MKKMLSLLLSLLMPVTAVTACSSPSTGADQPATPKKITPQQAKERIDSGDDVIILDVRTQSEYDEGHIAGAIVIPNESIVSAPAELDDKDAEILVYCRSGRRSAEAAQKLADLGYTQIYDFGGIIDWPYEITAG